MVSDQEPRYQLLDSSGNVVGTFYQKADGTLAVQDGVSESEVVFDGDTLGSGSETVDVGSVSTTDLSVDNVSTLAYASSNTSVADSTQTKIPLDSAVVDEQSQLNTSNNSVDAADAGLYLLSGTVFFDGAAGWTDGDTVGVRLTVNGTDQITNRFSKKVGTDNQSFAGGPSVRRLTAGDSISLEVIQFSGSSKTAESGSFKTFIQVSQLG